MASTYGFGGSEPTTGVSANTASTGGINTRSGDTTDNAMGEGTIQDGGTWANSTRGVSPVSGLGVVATFDQSIVKDMGGTTSIGSGVVSTLGAWPTTNHGALGDVHCPDPASVTSVTGASPGSASAMGYDGD